MCLFNEVMVVYTNTKSPESIVISQPPQMSMEGRTSEALQSLLEVDEDISQRLNKIVEEEPEVMEVIRTAIEAVTSVLLRGWREEDSTS